MENEWKREAFDVVIQAGQSNSEGCGLGPVTDPFVPSPEIWYLNPDLTVSPAQEAVWEGQTIGNFSLSFAAAYQKTGRLAEGRKLLIIRSAVGGTGFVDHHWGLQDDLFIRMMEMTRAALGGNPANRLKALLWHQGETDALGLPEQGLSPEEIFWRHKQNLTALVQAVRTEFQAGALPFVAGNFVPQWVGENQAICEPVVRAMRTVCDRIGHAAFVETDGLESNHQRIGNGDTIHFCREAQNLRGERYYQAFSRMASAD